MTLTVMATLTAIASLTVRVDDQYWGEILPILGLCLLKLGCNIDFESSQNDQFETDHCMKKPEFFFGTNREQGF